MSRTDAGSHAATDLPGRDLEGLALMRLRQRLEDETYMAAAVDELARGLCLEFLETEYGISFR